MSECTKPDSYMRFDATVYLLYHPTSSISAGFQCTVHVGSVRQTATVVAIHNEEVLNTNYVVILTMDFYLEGF